MSNQEILERAIRKAEDNGWYPSTAWAIWIKDGLLRKEVGYIVIYNHDFAKALWGNPDKNRYGDLVHEVRADITNPLFEWQYHLQQMVIADDPIEYLGEHI